MRGWWGLRIVGDGSIGRFDQNESARLERAREPVAFVFIDVIGYTPSEEQNFPPTFGSLHFAIGDCVSLEGRTLWARVTEPRMQIAAHFAKSFQGLARQRGRLRLSRVPVSRFGVALAAELWAI